LSILFHSGRNTWNISYQFKKQNKTEQFSPCLKSRVDPDFLVKFRPERSGRIPCISFRVKATESKSKTQNWTRFSFINYIVHPRINAFFLWTLNTKSLISLPRRLKFPTKTITISILSFTNSPSNLPSSLLLSCSCILHCCNLTSRPKRLDRQKREGAPLEPGKELSMNFKEFSTSS